MAAQKMEFKDKRPQLKLSARGRQLVLIIGGALACCWLVATVYRANGDHALRGQGNLLQSGGQNDVSSQLFEQLLTNAEARRKERDAWFASKLKRENEQLAVLPLHSFIGGVMLQPLGFCPADLVKEPSVAQVFDGGKWMCGLSRLRTRPSCVVYSLGCQFQTDFEEYIQTYTGDKCEVHVYDPTLEPPARVAEFKSRMEQRKIYLHEVAVSERTTTLTILGKERPAMSLRAMMEENKHECIDVLKFDVEGAEFAILEDTDWSKLCVGMVLFEIHGGKISKQTEKTYTVHDAVRHIRRLEDAGFLHYSTEHVYVGGQGQAEMAFVHRDWLAKKE